MATNISASTKLPTELRDLDHITRAKLTAYGDDVLALLRVRLHNAAVCERGQWARSLRAKETLVKRVLAARQAQAQPAPVAELEMAR